MYAPTTPYYSPWGTNVHPAYGAQPYPYPPAMTQGRAPPAYGASGYGAHHSRPYSYDAGPSYPRYQGTAVPTYPRSYSYSGSVAPVEYVTHTASYSPSSRGSNCVTVCNQPQPYTPMPTTILVVPTTKRRSKPKHYSSASSSSSSEAPIKPIKHKTKPHIPQPRPTPPLPKPTPKYASSSSSDDPNLRPWFGVYVKWLDEKVNGRVVGKDNVAVVQEVTPGSPADKAKIKRNDQLEYWNGQKIDGKRMWDSKMKSMRIGETVTIDVHRNGADLGGFKVRIEGTTQKLGDKKVVKSANKVETHNYGQYR